MNTIRGAKIVIVSQVYRPQKMRGAELVAEAVADELSLENDVTVLALGEESDTTINTASNSSYNVVRVPFIIGQRPEAGPLPYGRIGKAIWHARNSVSGVSARDLNQVLDRLSPDLIYLHNSSGFQPQLNRAALKRGIPVVAHLHDYNLMCPRTTMYRRGENCKNPCLDCRALTLAWRKNDRAIRTVISVSHFVKNRYQEQGIYSDADWHVLYNMDQSSMRTFEKKVKGSTAFGFIGAISPEKGIEDVIDAFQRLGEEDTPHLLIAGRGSADYMDKLASKSQGLNVTWLGQVDPNALYSSVDCVIVPSRWHEPQALVISECLNRGIPIIASSRGGNTEIVGSREGHLLFDPDIEDSLKCMINEFSAKRSCPVRENLSPEYFKSVQSILQQTISKQSIQ